MEAVYPPESGKVCTLIYTQRAVRGPHVNPIERLWGLMHRHTTHNKCYATFREFGDAMLTCPREGVPANWRGWCGQVTNNSRVINPKEFRIFA